MIETREKKIFDILTKDYDFHTSKEIADILNVSYKTIQKDICGLNDILVGAEIKSKRGAGYKFVIDNQEQFTNFLKNDWVKYSFRKDFNSSVEYRLIYIFIRLLFSDTYIKSADLAEELFISDSQFRLDLRKVREIFLKYDLTLTSKPYYGIKLEGREFNKRICIKKELLKNDVYYGKNLEEDRKQLEDLREIVKETFKRYNFHTTSFAFENIVAHIFVSIKRIKNEDNLHMGAKDLLLLREVREYKISDDILTQIKEKYNISFSEDEKAYIAMHILSKRTIEDDRNNSITENVDKLVYSMIEKVYETLNIDLRKDLDLRINLGLHIMPLIDRINYGLVLNNPILNDIKKDMISYEAGTIASQKINEKYGIQLEDDEVGYIALHFAVAIENLNESAKKKNVLIVCGTGKATAKILKNRFKKFFLQGCNSISTKDVVNLSVRDLNGIDLIVTSVPIRLETKIPIIEVGAFLSDSDIEKIKKVMENQKGIDLFFPREVFFSSLKAKDKKDVINKMVSEVKKNFKVDEGIIEEIEKREKLAPTEFDNLIAIPHPLNASSEKTFISIAILEKPIIWDQKEVQLVALFMIQKNHNKNLQDLYSKLGNFMTNEEKIKKVIEKRNYEYFIKLLNAM